ncbi:kelch-like protein 21 [Dreissena polymorpha]|uniref:BTB domain-containing protein n=1 Tax=Dreissena polymorpha TaxID=45954 RepID=A0A9D3YED9_DREPO|nr:kelch-like protein 21 [Dreissena polymorpha]KAH3697004.1 hypothetical protein DPMN_084489 [Dreissena polymorpha]
MDFSLWGEYVKRQRQMDEVSSYNGDVDRSFTRDMGSSTVHSMKMMQHLYDQLCAQSEFCDITLAFAGIEMKAHWCVLVACPYFQSLYNSGMCEKVQGKVHIRVGKLSAVRSAITFLYTGTIKIQYAAIRDILEVADYLQIDDLKSECTNYLMGVEVSISNCVHMCLLASQYDLDNYPRVFEYMRGHLPEVLQQPDMLILTAESVVEMIKDPTLSYVPRIDFFKFILKWVENDKEQRMRFFEVMFCALELQKMNKEFLEMEVETCEYVAMSEKCKVHLLNVKMKYMTGLLSADGKTDVMLLVGGCGMGPLFHAFYAVPFLPVVDLQSLNCVYGYVISDNRWVELAPLPMAMRRPIVAFHNQTSCLYVYDGSVGIPVEDKIAYLHKYDIVGKEWTTVQIRLPAPVDDITIHAILFLSDNQYMVASARPYSSDPQKTTQQNVYMFRINSDLTQCCTIETLCTRNFKTEVQVCVAEGKYICVMCYKCGPSGIKRNKTVRFFVKDVTKGQARIPEFSRGATHESLMFAINHEVYVTKPGCYRFRKFDLRTLRWAAGKELIVPYSEDSATSARNDFVHGTFKNKMFIFGGRNGKTLVNTACAVDVTARKLENLEPVPKPIADGTVIHARIPSDVISCHIDCPHCKYTSMRSVVSYNGVEYPDEDDIYDHDLSYDDEEDDDDMYSDFWDNDMYDRVDMYGNYDWF